MGHEPGQLAYETRHEGFGLGPSGVSPTWADLPVRAKAIWRRVEDVIIEATVNQRWRLLVSAEEAPPLRAVRLTPPEELPALRGSQALGEPAGFSRQPPAPAPGTFLDDTTADEISEPPWVSPIALTDEDRREIHEATAMMARTRGFSGNTCTSCGSFQMVRSGTCETCQACGSTGGCG